MPHRLRVHFGPRPPGAALARQLAAVGVVVVPRDQPAPAEIVVADARFTPPTGSSPWICVVETSDLARTAAAAGAYDVIPDGDPEALARRLVSRLRELGAEGERVPATAGVIAESPATKRMLAEVAHAARTSMPVLLTGETGTGKEVTARLLHAWSGRRNRRFVPINCAAIPNDLLESELFGHAKGAFSGAVQSYDGQIAAAEGGTVLLDEVDDTPAHFQIKLLRVLEDRVVSRLGENSWRKVDFRILAATNRDLRALVQRGLFGPDLYERLAIVAIHLPPLRERPEDIPVLAHHFVARYYEEEPAARRHHAITEVTAEALALLTAHRWPGNIRELRNVIYGALVRKRAGTALLVSDLPERLVRPSTSAPPTGALSPEGISDAIAAGAFDLRTAVATLERHALSVALARTAGNAAAAAALLGAVGRGRARDPGATVRAMMRRLGIPR